MTDDNMNDPQDTQDAPVKLVTDESTVGLEISHNAGDEGPDAETVRSGAISMYDRMIADLRENDEVDAAFKAERLATCDQNRDAIIDDLTTAIMAQSKVVHDSFDAANEVNRETDATNLCQHAMYGDVPFTAALAAVAAGLQRYEQPMNEPLTADPKGRTANQVMREVPDDFEGIVEFSKKNGSGIALEISDRRAQQPEQFSFRDLVSLHAQINRAGQMLETYADMIRVNLDERVQRLAHDSVPTDVRDRLASYGFNMGASIVRSASESEGGEAEARRAIMRAVNSAISSIRARHGKSHTPSASGVPHQVMSALFSGDPNAHGHA